MAIHGFEKKPVFAKWKLQGSTKNTAFFVLQLDWSSTASKYLQPISWNVRARFSTLVKLHEELMRQFPLSKLPNFPEKFALVNAVNAVSKDENSEAEFLEYRRIMLDSYFRELIMKESVMQSTALLRFLEVRENVAPAKEAARAAAQAAKAEEVRSAGKNNAAARAPAPAPAPAPAAAKQAKPKAAKPATEDVPDEAFDNPLAWMAEDQDE